MFKKSQAAMDFLITYGWAILIVLIMIGTLAYFGVLNPDKFTPCEKVLRDEITSEYDRCDVDLNINLRQQLDIKASELCENLRIEKEIYPEYKQKIEFMENNLVRGFLYIPESANLIENKPRIAKTGVEGNNFKWTGSLSGIITVFCIIPSETCYSIENITGCITNQDRMEFNYKTWSDWKNERGR